MTGPAKTLSEHDPRVHVLDNETFDKVSEELARAAAGGLNGVEHLYRTGWLLTPDIFVKIQLRTLQRLWDELDNLQPWELLVRQNKDTGGGTPADMYHAVLAYILDYRDYIKERNEP